MASVPAHSMNAEEDRQHAVWRRVWRYVPDDAQDDALLAREEHSHRWAIISKHLNSLFGTASRLQTVELGAGRGDLSVLLAARRRAEVTLVDICDEALQLARSRLGRLGICADFVKGDLFAVPKPLKGRFDLAVSSGVIEHFEGFARTDAIRAHCDVLHPGGLAVISVPYAWCIPYRLWKNLLEFRGWWPYAKEMPYSCREMVRRCRWVGLQPVEARVLGFWHSISSHWARGIFRFDVDWSNRRSWLDKFMGATLLMIAQKPERSDTSKRLRVP